VVVSEDGHVTMVPTLHPKVRHRDIQRHIQLMQATGMDTSRKVQLWLDKHRFYLNAEECESVNRELARLEATPQSHGERRFLVKRFTPNEQMDVSYYLDQ
jgi:hypothetical protein